MLTVNQKSVSSNLSNIISKVNFENRIVVY